MARANLCSGPCYVQRRGEEPIPLEIDAVLKRYEDVILDQLPKALRLRISIDH